jgi:hypothetical protein
MEQASESRVQGKRKQFKEQRLGSKAAIGTTEKARTKRAEADLLNEERAVCSL